MKRLIAIVFATCLLTPSAFAQAYHRLKCTGEESFTLEMYDSTIKETNDHEIWVVIDEVNNRIRIDEDSRRGEWRFAKISGGKVFSDFRKQGTLFEVNAEIFTYNYATRIYGIGELAETEGLRSTTISNGNFIPLL